MSKTYNQTGNVATTTQLNIPIDVGNIGGSFSITFYNADGDAVTPATGTVTVTASEDGYNFGSVTNGTIDVTKKDYARPNWGITFTSINVEFANVTGAITYTLRVTTYP